MVAHLDAGPQWPTPSWILCGPWRFADSVPSYAEEEELVFGGAQRIRMKKTQRRPAPCKASRPRVLTRGGGVSHFPLVETQLTPFNTPLTATSSTHFLVSAQLTPNTCIHLFIQQTSPMLGPQEASALAQFSRNTQSWERTELDIDTPSSMESEQG